MGPAFDQAQALISGVEDEDLHFDGNGQTEPVARYSVGGYHPVIINDVLRPTQSCANGSSSSSAYRILHKLGFGSYATVWLAEDTATRALVAVKVLAADGSSADEAEWLRRVQGSPHVPTLIDAFEVDGPNGTHLIVVSDVVMPLNAVLRHDQSIGWKKKVISDLAQGIAHLHSLDIVHGDIHTSNAGVALPSIPPQDVPDLLQDLCPYKVTVVLPISPEQVSPSLPAYIIESCDMAAYYHNHRSSSKIQAKLLDFGTAHLADIVPSNAYCANVCLAPETAYARLVDEIPDTEIRVDKPADIWALGTLMYEILFRQVLHRGSTAGILRRLASESGLGPVPEAWQSHWPEPFAPANDAPPQTADEWWSSRRDQLFVRQESEDAAEVDGAIGLLRKILLVDPSKRLTAAEVIDDVWFQ